MTLVYRACIALFISAMAGIFNVLLFMTVQDQNAAVVTMSISQMTAIVAAMYVDDKLRAFYEI